jgi:hypothetical protein
MKPKAYQIFLFLLFTVLFFVNVLSKKYDIAVMAMVSLWLLTVELRLGLFLERLDGILTAENITVNLNGRVIMKTEKNQDGVCK